MMLRTPGARECCILEAQNMEKNGYVLGPYGVELKQGWVKSIIRESR